jgi:hypothetical protein
VFFETDCIKQATPSFVSRVGKIFIDSVITIESLVKHLLSNSLKDLTTDDFMRALISYLASALKKILSSKRQYNCIVNASDFTITTACCNNISQLYWRKKTPKTSKGLTIDWRYGVWYGVSVHLFHKRASPDSRRLCARYLRWITCRREMCSVTPFPLSFNGCHGRAIYPTSSSIQIVTFMILWFGPVRLMLMDTSLAAIYCPKAL